MGCNFIKDENGRVVGISCGNSNEEWEKMVKELEERAQAEEKENDNDNESEL